MAVNHSVVRNLVMALTLLTTAWLTGVIASAQTRQARYQCENLMFQLHAQTVHRAEVYAMNGPNGFMREYYERELRKADALLWESGIPACHDHNPPLLP